MTLTDDEITILYSKDYLAFARAVIAAHDERLRQQEPEYYGLTGDHTWLSIDKARYDCLKPSHRMACYAAPIPTVTPSATWRTNGEPDPNGTRYDCERATLCMGKLTDDELANGAFMNYDIRPPIQDIIDGKAYSPVAWMTAVKDRIRWLSRSLEKALPARPEGEKK